jgi:signal transduction histidine kinase
MDSTKCTFVPECNYNFSRELMDNLSEQVILIIIASAFLLIVAFGIIFLVFNYQKKQLLYLREKEQLKVDFEKQILESKLEIQEHTLKHISQEIHDNIGQVLSLVKLTINTMNTSNPDLLKEKIDRSRELVGKAIKDLRSLSKSLHTDYVTDMGLFKSVEYELELLSNASSIEVDLVMEGNAYRLEQKQELIIFRIFQEVIQNIIKHSNATRVRVGFIYTLSAFQVEIADNGNGFDVSGMNGKKEEGSAGGIGLRNMENRAKLISADFKIESQPGKGTSVAIQLRLQENS